MRVESGGAFFSAELLIKLRAAGSRRGRGRGAALPANGGLGDRREAVGHPAGRARLLAAAAERLGEPPARAPPRRADPRRLSVRDRGLAALAGPALAAGSVSSELTKSRNMSSRGSTTPRRSRSRAAVAVGRVVGEPAAAFAEARLVEHGSTVGEDAGPGPDREGEGVARSGVHLDRRSSIARMIRAWIRLLGSARPRPRGRRGPRAPRAPTRTGRGSTGAPGSGPGASSRSSWLPTGRSRSAGSGRDRSP